MVVKQGERQKSKQILPGPRIRINHDFPQELGKPFSIKTWQCSAIDFFKQERFNKGDKFSGPGRLDREEGSKVLVINFPAHTSMPYDVSRSGVPLPPTLLIPVFPFLLYRKSQNYPTEVTRGIFFPLNVGFIPPCFLLRFSKCFK